MPIHKRWPSPPLHGASFEVGTFYGLRYNPSRPQVLDSRESDAARVKSIMPIEPRDLPPHLVTAVQGQSAVLFLGAAASYGAGHPKGEKILGADQLRNLIADQFLGGNLKDKPLSAVAEYAISEASLPTVQQFIRELLLEFTPAKFHLLIPRFRWHGLATTNYDLIIDKAYDPANSPLQTLVPFIKNGQQVETETKRVIDGLQFLKLHGSIDHYLDSDVPLILATEQYV